MSRIGIQILLLLLMTSWMSLVTSRKSHRPLSASRRRPRPVVHGISETFHKQDSKGNYQYGYHIKTHFGTTGNSPQTTHVYNSKKAPDPPSVILVNQDPDRGPVTESPDGDLHAVSSYKGKDKASDKEFEEKYQNLPGHEPRSIGHSGANRGHGRPMSTEYGPRPKNERYVEVTDSVEDVYSYGGPESNGPVTDVPIDHAHPKRIVRVDKISRRPPVRTEYVPDHKISRYYEVTDSMDEVFGYRSPNPRHAIINGPRSNEEGHERRIAALDEAHQKRTISSNYDQGHKTQRYSEGISSYEDPKRRANPNFQEYEQQRPYRKTIGPEEMHSKSPMPPKYDHQPEKPSYVDGTDILEDDVPDYKDLQPTVPVRRPQKSSYGTKKSKLIEYEYYGRPRSSYYHPYDGFPKTVRYFGGTDEGSIGKYKKPSVYETERQKAIGFEYRDRQIGSGYGPGHRTLRYLGIDDRSRYLSVDHRRFRQQPQSYQNYGRIGYYLTRQRPIYFRDYKFGQYYRLGQISDDYFSQARRYEDEGLKTRRKNYENSESPQPEVREEKLELSKGENEAPVSFPVGHARGPVVRKVVKARGPVSQPLVYDVQPIEIPGESLHLSEDASIDENVSLKGSSEDNLHNPSEDNLHPYLIELPITEPDENLQEDLKGRRSLTKVMRIVRRKDDETGKMRTISKIPVYTSVRTYDKESGTFVPIAYVHNPRAKATLQLSSEKTRG